MLLLTCTLTNGEVHKVATEPIRVGADEYKGVVKQISDLEIRSKSAYGGLVTIALGAITLTAEAFAAQDKFDVEVYLYLFGDVPTHIVTLGATLKSYDQDLHTYTLWDTKSAALQSTSTWYEYGLNDVVTNIATQIGVSNVVFHEETYWACSGVYQSAKASTVAAYVKSGVNVFDIVSNLLASRACVGIITGNTLDAYSIFSGHRSVIRVALAKLVKWKILGASQIKTLKIGGEHQCLDGQYITVTGEGGVVNTDTDHEVSPFGADIRAEAYAYYSTDRPHYLSTYVELFGRKKLEAVCTADIAINIGDLIILTDHPAELSFLVTGMRYSSSADTYTVYGVDAKRSYQMYLPDYFDWLPDVCPDWNPSGAQQTTTILATGKDGDRFWAEWQAVEGPILYAEIYIQTDSSFSYVCGTAVRRDGNKMRCTFPRVFSSGSWSLYIKLKGTTIGDPLINPTGYHVSVTF